MTRRSIILLLFFCLPFFAHAAPRSVPSSRPTSPPLVVKFRPEPDAWTSRTVVTTRLTLELSSTGASRLTTLTARRVMLAREELTKTKKGGLQRTTTLRSLTATRNGQLEHAPAEAALVGRPLGVRLSPVGKITGTVGLTAARDAVSARPEVDPLSENPATSADLAGATPEDEGLKDAWDEESGRYLGLKLVPGALLYFSERLRLPFLAKKELPYFSEQRVIGPVTVNGRPGIALEVQLFTLNMSQVPTGISPTTGPTSAFADWARKSRVRLSFPDMQVRGVGRRVVALDGKGLLEQDSTLDVTLSGALATEAAGATKPATTRVHLHAERQQRSLSGPPALATAGSGRSAAGRGESRKAPRQDPE